MASKQNNLSISSDIGFRWWFVFLDSDHPVIRRALEPGFSHVLAFCEMGNVCLVVEPMLGCVNHIITEAPAKELIKEAKEKGATVVCYASNPTPNKFLMRPPWISCASFLAYTVGFKCYSLTPYQLYRKLLSCNHDVI